MRLLLDTQVATADRALLEIAERDRALPIVGV